MRRVPRTNFECFRVGRLPHPRARCFGILCGAASQGHGPAAALCSLRECVRLSKRLPNFLLLYPVLRYAHWKDVRARATNENTKHLKRRISHLVHSSSSSSPVLVSRPLVLSSSCLSSSASRSSSRPSSSRPSSSRPSFSTPCAAAGGRLRERPAAEAPAAAAVHV